MRVARGKKSWAEPFYVLMTSESYATVNQWQLLASVKSEPGGLWGIRGSRWSTWCMVSLHMVNYPPTGPGLHINVDVLSGIFCTSFYPRQRDCSFVLLLQISSLFLKGTDHMLFSSSFLANSYINKVFCVSKYSIMSVEKLEEIQKLKKVEMMPRVNTDVWSSLNV